MITDSRAAEIQDQPVSATSAEVVALAVTVQELRDDLALAHQDLERSYRSFAEMSQDYISRTVRQQDKIRTLQAERQAAAERILELTAEMEGCHRDLSEYRRERQESADQIADMSGLVENLRARLQAANEARDKAELDLAQLQVASGYESRELGNTRVDLGKARQENAEFRARLAAHVRALDAVTAAVTGPAAE
jgi:chromosome segregation ATPase